MQTKNKLHVCFYEYMYINILLTNECLCLNLVKSMRVLKILINILQTLNSLFLLRIRMLEWFTMNVVGPNVAE